MPKEGFKYRDPETETFCGLVVMYPKLEGNVGTLFRTAAALDCVDFFATIGERYDRTRGDTIFATRRKPCFQFKTFEDFTNCMPQNCDLVGVEISHESKSLESFSHPVRAVYLFGAEDTGIPANVLKVCRYKVQMPSPLGISMNLSASGSILLWDRILKKSMNHS